jgi:hypothetical protein
LGEKIRRLKWVGHIAHMGERRGAHRIFVGKSEGKRLLRRPSHRLEENIKMDLQEMGLVWPRRGTGGGLLLMQY